MIDSGTAVVNFCPQTCQTFFFFLRSIHPSPWNITELKTWIINHAWKLPCHRYPAIMHILRSKCLGSVQALGVFDHSNYQFYRYWRSHELSRWDRELAENQTEALHLPKRHACHSRLPQQSQRESFSSGFQHGVYGKLPISFGKLYSHLDVEWWWFFFSGLVGTY